MSKERWTTVTLGDIAENISVRVDDPSKSGLDRFVGLQHLDSGSVMVSEWGSTESVTSSMKQFKAGDVLLARRNAHLRRASAVDFEGVCSGDAYVLREKPDAIVPGLLKYILNSNRFWEFAIANADGSMSTRVKWKSLEEFEVDIPPTRLSMSILSLLDAWMVSTKNYEESIPVLNHTNSKLISESLFVKGQNYGKYVLPEGWSWKRLNEISIVEGGRQRSPKFAQGPNMVEYLRVANIGDGEISFDDVLSMHFSDVDYKKYLLRHGDIMVVEGHANSMMVGRCAIFTGSGRYCFQNTLIRIRVDGNEALPEYLELVLNELRKRQILLGIVYGTSINHLGSTRLAKILIPVPPIPHQKAVVKQNRSFKALLQNTHNSIDAHRVIGHKLIALFDRGWLG